MRNGLSHRAFFESESLQESGALCACLVMAFKHCHLHDVIVCIGLNESILHLQINDLLIVSDAVRDDLDHAGLHAVSRALRRSDLKAVRRDIVTDMHCVVDQIREV